MKHKIQTPLGRSYDPNYGEVFASYLRFATLAEALREFVAAKPKEAAEGDLRGWSSQRLQVVYAAQKEAMALLLKSRVTSDDLKWSEDYGAFKKQIQESGGLFDARAIDIAKAFEDSRLRRRRLKAVVRALEEEENFSRATANAGRAAKQLLREACIEASEVEAHHDDARVRVASGIWQYVLPMIAAYRNPKRFMNRFAPVNFSEYFDSEHLLPRDPIPGLFVAFKDGSRIPDPGTCGMLPITVRIWGAWALLNLAVRRAVKWLAQRRPEFAELAELAERLSRLPAAQIRAAIEENGVRQPKDGRRKSKRDARRVRDYLLLKSLLEGSESERYRERTTALARKCGLSLPVIPRPRRGAEAIRLLAKQENVSVETYRTSLRKWRRRRRPRSV